MSTFYSPLRYPGGKNCIFPFITNLLQENNLVGYSYAEPYAGGAGLALRLLAENYVEHIYINDLDKSIYAFWVSIMNKPDSFCKWIEKVDVSVNNWNKYKKIQEKAEKTDAFNLAKSTFFLNRTNVSGIIKGGIIGGKAQEGYYKIDARFNKGDLISRIQKIAAIKNRITISNLDGLTFAKKIDRMKKKAFIYLDPPYYKKGANLYMNFYMIQDHEKLARYVHQIRKDWIVSYDNHEFILNLYTKNKKVIYRLSQSTSNRVGDEILIFSKDLRFSKSINSLKFPVML